jgi:hypothetical protein
LVIEELNNNDCKDTRVSVWLSRRGSQAMFQGLSHARKQQSSRTSIVI